MTELDLFISNHLLDFFFFSIFMFIHLRPWPCNFALLGHNGSVYYESALERRFDVWFPLLDLHPGGRYILLFCVDSLLLNLRTFHGVVASPWYLALLSELITSTLSLFLFPPSNVFSPYWIVASTLDSWESTKTTPSHPMNISFHHSSGSFHLRHAESWDSIRPRKAPLKYGK